MWPHFSLDFVRLRSLASKRHRATVVDSMYGDEPSAHARLIEELFLFAGDGADDTLDGKRSAAADFYRGSVTGVLLRALDRYASMIRSCPCSGSTPRGTRRLRETTRVTRTIWTTTVFHSSRLGSALGPALRGPSSSVELLVPASFDLRLIDARNASSAAPRRPCCGLLNRRPP